MQVKIANEVFLKYPNYRCGVLVAKNLRVGDQSNNVLSNVMNSMMHSFVIETYQSMAEGECQMWRNAYKSMGLKASKVLCSFESLYKRVRKLGNLPRINPIVDAYNLICLKHCLCLGAYDLNALKGNVEIRFAENGEQMIPIGANDPIVLTDAAVVYSDQASPICAFLNHRDADRTKVTENSNDVVFCIDELYLNSARIEAALNDLAHTIRAISLPGLELKAFFHSCDGGACEYHL